MKRFIFWGCSKCKEGKIIVLPLRRKFVENLILLIGRIGFQFAFKTCIFLKRNRCICQSFLEFSCRFTGLRRMCFVNNDCKIMFLTHNFFIDNRELLQCRYNNGGTIINSVFELCGVLIDLLYNAVNVIKLINGILQLTVKHFAVGNNNNRAEDLLVKIIVKPRKTM